MKKVKLVTAKHFTKKERKKMEAKQREKKILELFKQTKDKQERGYIFASLLNDEDISMDEMMEQLSEALELTGYSYDYEIIKKM